MVLTSELSPFIYLAMIIMKVNLKNKILLQFPSGRISMTPTMGLTNKTAFSCTAAVVRIGEGGGGG